MEARLRAIVLRMPFYKHDFREKRGVASFNGDCAKGTFRNAGELFPKKAGFHYQTQPYPAGYLARRPERIYWRSSDFSAYSIHVAERVYRSRAGSTGRDIGRRVTGSSGEYAEIRPSQNRSWHGTGRASGCGAFRRPRTSRSQPCRPHRVAPRGRRCCTRDEIPTRARARPSDPAPRIAGTPPDGDSAFTAEGLVRVAGATE